MSFVSPAEIQPTRLARTRFFANRREMILGLKAQLPPRPRVVEVGVALGDFSEFLLEALDPAEFVGIDTFDMHHLEVVWGRRTAEIFTGRTHEAYFRDRFAARGAQVKVLHGFSFEQLATLEAGSCDLIYVDAAHDFENVSRDLAASLRCLAPNGLIVANDYTLFDPFMRVDYGVVQAVNEFLESNDFEMEGFALEKNMFCDVALRRRVQVRVHTPPGAAPASTPMPTLGDPGSQLCTASQFGEPDYDRLCAEIRQQKLYHRKQWEYIYTLRMLEKFDLLRPGVSGLGFGCGKEPLAVVMAKRGCAVLATDIRPEVDGDRFFGSTSVMDYFYEGICDKDTFLRNVSFREVNMNAIPEDLGRYDFLWSCCAFEHIGSLEHGLQFVLNANRHLKPGGVAIHTTEYNVSSDDETYQTPNLSLYRRRDLEDLARRVEAAGDRILPLDFTLGDLPQDNYVDLPPYQQNPHIRLLIEKYVTTSFGFAIVKGG